MTDSRTTHMLAELIDWRTGMTESGRGPELLPTDADLVLLAGTVEIKRPALELLGLERTSALSSFGAGILGAMRTGLANHEAGFPPPTLPPPFAQAIAPRSASKAESVKEQVAALLSGFRAGADLGRDSAEPTATPDSPAPAPTRRQRHSGGRDAAAATPTGTSPVPDHPGGERAVSSTSFAPYDASRAGAEPRSHLTVSTRPDGSLQVEWQPPPTQNPVKIYRVIVSDEWVPWSPDASEVIATTTSTSTVFDREYGGPVRHLQVWVNEGPDDATARAAQPDLLARGQSVAPPTDVRLSEDHGTVYGTWKVASGVDRVEVLRVPIDAIRRDRQLPQYLPQYRIGTNDAALQGIQDTGCPSGEEFEYRLFSIVMSADGELTSDPAVARISVGGSLTPVREVRAVLRDDAGRRVVDLEWDQPTAGSVQIYRTEKLPTATTTTGLLAHSALAGAGLADDFRIPTQPHWTDGVGSLRNVPWPPNWSRVHFTAVTVDRTNSLIGDTATLRLTGVIDEVALHQRVTWQLLTFSWPTGADEVHVYQGPVGAGLPDPPGEPIDRMDVSRHRGLGGIRLQGSLDRHGCDVHLVPISFYEGAERGTPATVTYRGLFRMAYRLTGASTGGREGGRRGGGGLVSTVRTVEVRGDLSVPPEGLAVSLTLVARSERMPLSVNDGQRIATPWHGPGIGSSGPGGWTPIAQFDPSTLPAGSFVRLFLTTESAPVDVALIDPPLAELRT